MSDPETPFRGLLEPDAEKLAIQLHGLNVAGTKVSDAALVTPMLMSLAISAKRIADHFTPPPDQRVGGFSQAEHNLGDMLNDKLHDFANAMRRN